MEVVVVAALGDLFYLVVPLFPPPLGQLWVPANQELIRYPCFPVPPFPHVQLPQHHAQERVPLLGVAPRHLPLPIPPAIAATAGKR